MSSQILALDDSLRLNGPPIAGVNLTPATENASSSSDPAAMGDTSRSVRSNEEAIKIISVGL